LLHNKTKCGVIESHNEIISILRVGIVFKAGQARGLSHKR
jgi:hypothetical protein